MAETLFSVIGDHAHLVRACAPLVLNRAAYNKRHATSGVEITFAL